MRKSHLGRTDILTELLYLAPQLLLFGGLTLLPFAVSIPIVFTDKVDYLDTETSFIWFQNFLNVFRPPIVNSFLPALLRTVVFTGVNYLTTFLFAVPIALVMYELAQSLFKRVFFVVIYLPLMISGVGLGMIITMLFSQDTGSLNLLLLKLGVLQSAIDVQSPDVIVMLPFAVGWRYAGQNMALILAGLLTIPAQTIEAAIIDGANYMQRLVRIYVPQIMSSVLVVTIFTLIGSFGMVDELIGLGGLTSNRNAEFLSIVILKFGFGGSGESRPGALSEGVAINLIVYIPLLIVGILILRKQIRRQLDR